MKIINASTEILTPITGDELRQIEYAGRTCYKSEDKITDDSAKKFVENLIKRGHEAMLEHGSLSVKFICDRGVSHELVRHRLASFAQESTRYCNYSKDKFGNELTFIKPIFLEEDSDSYEYWENAMSDAEIYYFAMLGHGCTPQEARSVLPNSIKTEVVMTANYREWRHFFWLRAARKTGPAHPQMEELTIPLLREVVNKIPVVFDDIYRSLLSQQAEKEKTE
uniref:Thymidylate synthase complementing protein n=1 Tax=Siphoviridae sp. ctJT77 TaxID=2825432 RepID=A0A8S5UZT3_9CAUD|nr:MAG TPA: Thymidylate synthase complementing protein [Siphoviridae sp. ctJT77]